MTRAAWRGTGGLAARAPSRLRRRSLEGLSYCDPAYAYDIGYEYEANWNTDSNQAVSGIHRYEFDEDSILSPSNDGGRKSSTPCVTRPATSSAIAWSARRRSAFLKPSERIWA